LNLAALDNLPSLPPFSSPATLQYSGHCPRSFCFLFSAIFPSADRNNEEMRAQRPQRPSLDTSFSSLSLETSKESGSAYKPQRDRADSAASHSSSSAFATPPEGHSPRHSLIPTTNSTSSAATATQENFDGPFKSDDTINLTHSPRTLHTRTASVGSPPLHEIVKAKYDYVPDHPSGLPFYAGQLIQVHYKDPSGWWDGEVANVRGWFPSNYLFPDSSKLVRASSQVSSGHFSPPPPYPFLFFFPSCQSPLRIVIRWPCCRLQKMSTRPWERHGEPRLWVRHTRWKPPVCAFPDKFQYLPNNYLGYRQIFSFRQIYGFYDMSLGRSRRAETF
jgi:SH3 domain